MFLHKSVITWSPRKYYFRVVKILVFTWVAGVAAVLAASQIKKGECGLELELRSHIDPDSAATWRAPEWRPGDCASSTSNPPCDEMTSSLCWSPTTYSSGGIPILLRTSAKRRLASETFDLRERENMKRRNGQAEGKRRPVKRTKLTDNIFGR